MPKPKTRISRPKRDRAEVKTKAKGSSRAPTVRSEPKAKIQKARKKTRRPNILVRWWNETRGELRRVIWPTWAEVRYLTVVVLLVTFVTSAFFGFVDWLFLQVVGFLIGV